MRNVGGSARRSKIQRILCARDRIRRISEKWPAFADIPQQIDAVFEAAAADNPGAIVAIRQCLQGRYQPVAVDRTREVDPDMAAGVNKRILVTEPVGHQWNVTSAPRTCGKCPAGSSGY